MRRVRYSALATVAFFGFASVASAADLPVKASPAPVRASTWTGCYIGGHVGWGWGRKTFSDTSDPNSGSVQAFTGQSSIDVDTDGFLGGGQVGCDYQFDARWVVGVEGQFSWADISGSASGGRTFIDPQVGLIDISASFHAKTDWLASATARLGYAWDPRWLLYVKGGAAWAHDKYDIPAQISTTALGTSSGAYVASETRTGWTVGGGLEWAFADHWSTKVEYQFYDFGSRDLTFVPIPSTGIPIGDPTVVNVKQQIHTVKLGVNYRF